MATPNNPTPPDNESFKDQRDILREINEELGKQINHIKDASKAYSGLESIAKKLQNDEEELSRLSAKQLTNLKTKAAINFRDLKSAAEKLNYTNATTDAEIALLVAKEDEFRIEEALLKSIQKRLDQEININKSLGISGNLLKGMSGLLNKLGLGALNNVINFEEINKKLRDQAKLLTNNGEKSLGFVGKLQLASNAVGLVGGQLFKALFDPLALLGLLIKGFKQFIEIGFKADTQVTNLSKSMAISKDQAILMRDRFVEIQNSGQSIFETTENLVGAQLELATAFGATTGFSEQMVRDQVLLTKQMGFSVEEAQGLQQLAMANGMSAKDVTNSVIKQTSALARQTGIQLDNKKVIGEVAKVSGQLRLQYQNNPALIAAAVVQTQKLGISLEQAAKASRSLLDFESSISNELEAELLTGKDLNFEKARLLALNGKSAEAAAEMLKQVGSVAEFNNMNVIQQDALAKSMGMQTDELANSLIQQENLNRLGDESKKQIEEKAELLRKNGDIDGANRLMNSIGNEEEAQAALDRISAQDRFTAAMEKLKAMIASIVEGPAMKFVNVLANLLSNATALKVVFAGLSTIMVGIGAIKLAGLIAQLTSAAVASGALSATTAATASAITFGVGALAIAAGIATIMAAVSSAQSSATQTVKDGQADASRGPFQITDKFGATAGTTVGDSLYVSPNIKNGPPPSSGGSIDISPLISQMQTMNAILSKIESKEGKVTADTNEIGKASNMATYKVFSK
jgi:hypothetical protein